MPYNPDRCRKFFKSAFNSNHIKQNFTVITIWGGGDYQLRSALAAKQIWVAVITIWGTLDSLPPSTKQPWYFTGFDTTPWRRSIYRIERNQRHCCNNKIKTIFTQGRIKVKPWTRAEPNSLGLIRQQKNKYNNQMKNYSTKCHQPNVP